MREGDRVIERGREFEREGESLREGIEFERGGESLRDVG